MKYFLLLSLLVTSHSTCDQVSKMKVTKATEQKYSGGAVGSNRGMYYYVYIQMKPDSNYHFDSLWVAGSRLAVKKAVEESNDTVQVVSANKISPLMNLPDDIHPKIDTTTYKFPI